MRAEVNGIGFANKGAVLMLRAVEAALAGWPGQHEVAVRLNRQALPSVLARQTKAVLGWPRIGSIGQWYGRVLPAPLRSLSGLWAMGDADVLLDASGFAFGDVWGIRPAANLAVHAAWYQQRGRKVVLLPQAFGPFEKPEVAEAFLRAAEHVDRFYARDPVSLSHLQSLLGEDERVSLCPDFTNLLSVSPVRPPAPICVVPNYRMLDKGDAAGDYQAFLLNVLRSLDARGREFCLLLHDDGDDQQLADWLQERAGRALAVVREADPLRLKALLGGAELVISSRYHALVGALSQAVPVLATGWTHKYQALLRDYDCEAFLLGDLADAASTDQLLERLLDPAESTELRQRLTAAGTVQRQASAAMWEDVRGLVGVAA